MRTTDRRTSEVQRGSLKAFDTPCGLWEIASSTRFVICLRCPSVPEPVVQNPLTDRRVAFVGKLAGMPRRDAQQLVKAQGAVVAESSDPAVDLIVVGESEWLSAHGIADKFFDQAQRERAESGQLEIITETELWQRVGLVDAQHAVQRLYTPAMLADLLGVPVAVIRRWHRRGLIVPAREVRR